MSLENLKHILGDQDSWNWLVASDIMGAVKDRAFAAMPLKDVVERMSELCRPVLFHFMHFFINCRAYIAQRSMPAFTIIKHLNFMKRMYCCRSSV